MFKAIIRMDKVDRELSFGAPKINTNDYCPQGIWSVEKVFNFFKCVQCECVGNSLKLKTNVA